MKTMISVAEAQEVVLSQTKTGLIHVMPLKHVLGAVLAAPVRAQINVPAFDNSAMDGFALDHRVTEGASPETPVRLPVVGYQAAGIIHFGSLKPGNALRIATGAFFPLDATAVIPQEDVREDGDTIIISAPVSSGAHVRYCSEETKRGEEALAAGAVITPSALGYLASIGVAELPVIARPRVGIVATGTELVPLGGTPGPGQIYDSNSITLAAALQVDGIAARVYPALADDPKIQLQALGKVMSENDIVLVTGGVSVGRYDHVKDIMQQLEISPVFWKVRQKPGKPLVFGVRDQALFFGLPGNPASTLTSYYEYVRPALRKMMGFKECLLPEFVAQCKMQLTKELGKTYFLKAKVTCCDGAWRVTPYSLQGSHSMRSFAETNALIVLPEDVSSVAKDECVHVHMLPQSW